VIRDILNEIVSRGDAFLYDSPFTSTSTRQWVDSHTAAFVAEGKGGIDGGYVIRPNQPGRGNHVCNAAYMVAESARGKGAGRILGEHSLAEAKRLGFTAMQFNAVVSTNTPAVALWTSLGFRVIGTLPAAFRLPDSRFSDLHVMFRDL
jgi:L-amino acid N-acyltransferase YncA